MSTGEIALDINLTLVVQMLVFLVFAWFTMKFVWPPLSKAMEERQDKIADGLAAAERGRKELELAQHRIKDDLKKAKVQAAEIVEKANVRATQLIESAKEDAKLEAQKQAKIIRDQLQQEFHQARDRLRKDVAQLAIAGAKKILVHEMNEKSNSALLDDLIKEI